MIMAEEKRLDISQKERAEFEREVAALNLSEEERAKFEQEIEAELPDWARDEEGKLRLTLYRKVAQRTVLRRWARQRGKSGKGLR